MQQFNLDQKPPTMNVIAKKSWLEFRAQLEIDLLSALLQLLMELVTRTKDQVLQIHKVSLYAGIQSV